MFKMTLLFIASLLSFTVNASYSTEKIYLNDFNKHKDTIYHASKVTGFSMHTGTAIASIESGIKNIKNKHSDANGVFQYKPRTWESDKKKYAKKYGVSPYAEVTDSKANIIIGMASLAEQKNYLIEHTSLKEHQIKPGDIYMAHFLGQYGASKVLNGNPNHPIGKYVTITYANKSRFYRKGKQLNVKEFREHMNDIVNKRTKVYSTAINQYQLNQLIKQVEVKYDIAKRYTSLTIL